MCGQGGAVGGATTTFQRVCVGSTGRQLPAAQGCASTQGCASGGNVGNVYLFLFPFGSTHFHSRKMRGSSCKEWTVVYGFHDFKQRGRREGQKFGSCTRFVGILSLS